MHSKSGKEIKLGDVIVARNWQQQPFTGLVVGLTPGSTSCNISVIPLPAQGAQTLNAHDVLHQEEAIQGL